MTPSTGAALVTGCSTGIGRATALALHRAGLAVVATARRPETLADLAALGIETLALDVTSEESMTEAVRTVEERHGHVSVLVNNAGYALQGPVEDTAIEAVRDQFETNVVGLVRLTQLVLPGMRAAGAGRVVNIGSMGGRFTFPGGGFYHASKHAVEAVSDALRLEVAPFGVQVVLIQPGPVQSAFVDSAVATLDSGPARTPSSAPSWPSATARPTTAPAPTSRSRPRPWPTSSCTAATSGRPRARYAVGLMAKTLITTRRLLPDVAWDGVIRRVWPTPRAPR